MRLLWKREEGQTMAEYGVVLAVITIACLVAFTALSGGITNAIDHVVNVLPH
ncbi:MAG: Flp family type IVb pilin [Gaiellaceae bacterium]